MSNFVERFKLRSVPDLLLDVPVGPITFKVHRFAEAEKEGARKMMAARLKEEGYDPKNIGPDEQNAQNVAFGLSFADVIKRHIKGWSLEDEFSATALDVMWSEMTAIERLELTAAYLNAEAEALKKNQERSRRNSLNGASAGSSTRSETLEQTVQVVSDQ